MKQQIRAASAKISAISHRNAATRIVAAALGAALIAAPITAGTYAYDTAVTHKAEAKTTVTMAEVNANRGVITADRLSEEIIAANEALEGSEGKVLKNSAGRAGRAELKHAIRHAELRLGSLNKRSADTAEVLSKHLKSRADSEWALLHGLSIQEEADTELRSLEVVQARAEEISTALSDAEAQVDKDMEAKVAEDKRIAAEKKKKEEAAKKKATEETARQNTNNGGGGGWTNNGGGNSGGAPSANNGGGGGGRAHAEALFLRYAPAGSWATWANHGGCQGSTACGFGVIGGALTIAFSSGTNDGTWYTGTGEGVAVHEAGHLRHSAAISKLRNAGYSWDTQLANREAIADCFAQRNGYAAVGGTSACSGVAGAMTALI